MIDIGCNQKFPQKHPGSREGLPRTSRLAFVDVTHNLVVRMGWNWGFFLNYLPWNPRLTPRTPGWLSALDTTSSGHPASITQHLRFPRTAQILNMWLVHAESTAVTVRKVALIWGSSGMAPESYGEVLEEPGDTHFLCHLFYRLQD